MLEPNSILCFVKYIKFANSENIQITFIHSYAVVAGIFIALLIPILFRSQLNI